MASESPFRFATYIQKGVPLSSEEMKEFAPFLMAKLYYYAGYHAYANFLNMMWSLPKESQYRLFCILFKNVYPRGWIKSTKTKDKEGIEVEYLKKKFGVSSKVAKEYAELLSAKDKKEIKQRFE